MSHYEILFPTDISYGVRGGPMWNTSIVKRSSGHEQRNKRWATPLWSYPDVAHHARAISKIDDLYDFFITVGEGSANSFNFKDWADYTISSSDGRLGTTAVGTGHPTYQLYKRYTYGARTFDRAITKPKASSLTVYKNGVAQTESVHFTVDNTTGIVTFTAVSTLTITNISQANPAVVTYTGTDPTNGQVVFISGVVGMTQVNDLYFTVANVNAGANTFELQGINSSAYAAYSSDGAVSIYPQAADALTFACTEFYVPVRFVNDMMEREIIAPNVHGWQQIPLVEVRV